MALEARKRLADRIRRTHPDRVPIIVERHPKSHNVPETSKRKYVTSHFATNVNLIVNERSSFLNNQGFWHLGILQWHILFPN